MCRWDYPHYPSGQAGPAFSWPQGWVEPRSFPGNGSVCPEHLDRWNTITWYIHQDKTEAWSIWDYEDCYQVWHLLHTSHIDNQSWELLRPLDMLLGWLVVIVCQTSVGTLQVELDSQFSVLWQQRLAFQHCERGERDTTQIMSSLLTIQSQVKSVFLIHIRKQSNKASLQAYPS